MLILALDSSTYSGSVALIRDGVLIGEAVATMRGVNEERLMPAIAQMMAQNRVVVDQLEGVACGAGPGSFTSLRIAASIAKGLCASREIPLLVAPSTLLVVSAARPALSPGNYVVAIDAMRGDFFWQDVVVDSGDAIVPGASSRSTRVELERHASGAGARIIGPAESTPTAPHARGFARLVDLGIAKAVEMTSWEPNYGRKAEAQVRWETTHGRELGPV